MHKWFRVAQISAMICLMVFCQLGGQVLKGEAWGDSEDRARNGALASLSQSIYVKVETTITATEGEENFRAFARTVKEVTTTSNLPLLGTTFTPVEKKGREFKVTVMLDPARALSLYEDRLSALQKDLDEAAQFLKDGGDAVLRYNRLIKANGELEEFDIYRFIYLALGGKKTYTVPLTQSQISSALHKLTATFDDLELALKHHITRIINYSMIYVHYPALYPSKEVTQFSRIVRDRLIAMLKVTENLEQAQYHLRSSYEITEEGMVLTLRLVSPEGKIEQAEFIRLSPPAYQAYRYMPSNFDVAQSIASGELISNKLLVQFSGLDGSDQLFFVKGDLAGFKIRANMPVEYYIIGHNYSAEGVYSYLLPLKSGFIGRINSDQVNRWIQLPVFEVIEPFGVETLQVIASTGDLSKSLPPVVRDHKNGLYKITGDPSTAVFRTRGLTPPQEEVETAEATLTMTLMEK